MPYPILLYHHRKQISILYTHLVSYLNGSQCDGRRAEQYILFLELGYFQTVPVVGSSSPVKTFIIVDFPAPLTPTQATLLAIDALTVISLIVGTEFQDKLKIHYPFLIKIFLLTSLHLRNMVEGI